MTTPFLERSEQKLPSMYKVVLLNDDFTPMEFVVMVVREYFKKDRELRRIAS